jgi:hypothetical protein
MKRKKKKRRICALLVMRIEEDRPRLNVYKNRFLTYGLFITFVRCRRRLRSSSQINDPNIFINIRISTLFLPMKKKKKRHITLSPLSHLSFIIMIGSPFSSSSFFSRRNKRTPNIFTYLFELFFFFLL